METTKVIIQNWPSNPWYKEWIPIIIGIIALFMSLFSLYWSNKESTRNARPYVWATNYVVVDDINHKFIPILFKVMLHVQNSPTKIVELQHTISIDKITLSSYKTENAVKFPSENGEWTFEVGKVDRDRIMNLSLEDKSKLRRSISIKYSSLDGGKIYEYKIKQQFYPNDNDWLTINESSD